MEKEIKRGITRSPAFYCKFSCSAVALLLLLLLPPLLLLSRWLRLTAPASASAPTRGCELVCSAHPPSSCTGASFSSSELEPPHEPGAVGTAPSSTTARLATGMARKVGLSSPAMMTTTCSWNPAAGLAAPAAEPFSPSAPASPARRSRSASRYPESFQYEQARMSNAKAMSPSIAASPPKRYGTGDCHGECGAVPFAPGAAVGAPWLTVGNSAPGLMVA